MSARSETLSGRCEGCVRASRGCVVRPPPTLAYSWVRSPQLACDVRGGSDGSGQCSRLCSCPINITVGVPLCNAMSRMFSLAHLYRWRPVESS